MHSNHIDIKELKKQGDVDGLIDILNTGNIKEKREAAFALGEIRSKRAVRSLIGLLRKDDVQIRANAAWALGEIGKKDAVISLIELLNDISQIVQLHAAWALGRIGDSRAIPDLYVAMKSSSAEFRKVAKDAIARIEEGRGVKEEDEDIPENIDKSLITLNIPENFIFNYPSLEGESKHESTIRITNGVIIEDTGDGRNKNSLRKVTVGLENPQNVSVSIDILFRCLDRTTGETKSAWLQLGNTGIFNSNHDIKEIEEKRDLKNKMRFSGLESQTQLRILPAEELKGEISGLGDSIVLIEVNLNGKDMNGKMQIYFSRDTGIEIANELLCTPPEAYCKEFNEDIMSTLGEVVNIFGGQYVNSISESIGETILVATPKFEIGGSLQIAESVMKDINGKVDFVLASNLSLGKNRAGRMIMLIDPKSYEKIVSKLF